MFKDQEIAETTTLRRNLTLATIYAAFVIAIISVYIGFRLIIGRPLSGLLTAIRAQH